MNASRETIDSLIEDFQGLGVKDRLMLLLEFSDNLPALPPRYADHPDLLERVEECQSPVFLFVEVDAQKVAHLFFTAPAEAPTTRGFASILHEVLDGLSAAELLAVDDDFPSRLGLTEAVSPLRMNGMRAMLARIKRQVREKLASA
jgi:cysteine desulfuration protein SufE